MTDEPSQRLDLLILARLSRDEWSSQLSKRLAALRAMGGIDDRRVPTPKGLERMRGALGVRELPTKWSEFSRALLPALALALPGSQWSEVASADKLRARIIRQDRRLSLPELPTLAQAVDAQIWQALGLDETGPLTLGALRRAVLERTLGISLRAKSIDVADVGQWLASAATGTPARTIVASQRALVRQWLLGGGASGVQQLPVVTSKAGASQTLPHALEPLPLERWAEQVQALAETTSAGRYGDERVFIAAVWRAAQAGPAALHGPLPAFKTRLVEANRAGLLRLHRADLVGAMDPQLVHESETQHLNATFHFVEIQPRRAS